MYAGGRVQYGPLDHGKSRVNTASRVSRRSRAAQKTDSVTTAPEMRIPNWRPTIVVTTMSCCAARARR